jgi:hypothetical protein
MLLWNAGLRGAAGNTAERSEQQLWPNVGRPRDGAVDACQSANLVGRKLSHSIGCSHIEERDPERARAAIVVFQVLAMELSDHVGQRSSQERLEAVVLVYDVFALLS